MHSDVTPNDFISQLVNDGLSSVPWLDSTFTDDFILLAEFSELEGPKHIFTIPRDIKTKFNLETFAVRIMSVDCVSILQTTDLTNFNIAGDIQVVLTEVSEGAVAYVHHFVLYDIRARGYVRPYCMAYVTRNHSRLMSIFESLLQCFSLVSYLFHFGNAMNFVNDLVSRWEHLYHLNSVLADKAVNIYVGEKILSVAQKESIMKTDIDESISQMVELHKIFLLHLDSEMYSEHREIFNERYKQTCQHYMEPRSYEKQVYSREDSNISNFSEYSDSINTLVSDFVLPSTSHEIPEDVIASLLGKKYDKPLRRLTELCDVTYTSGLHILKCILKKHSSANVTLSTGILFKLPSTIEQVVRKNFEHIDGDSPFIPDDGCYEPKKTTVTLKQFLTASFCPVADTRKTSAFEIENSFLSSMTVTSLEKPITRNTSYHSNTGSFVSISSNGNFMTSPNISPASSSGSYREHTLSDITSTTDSFAEYDKISLTRSVIGSIVEENGILDNVDTLKYSRISILGLRRRFSFLAHAVFSLLIGRSLVIIGEEKSKNKVRHLVFGLANFLPCKGNSVVIPWLQGPFSVNQLSTPGIVGLLKCQKGKTIPNSLKPYVSILDVEEETLLAPQYDGKFLNSMLGGSTYFTSDSAYRQFIVQLFTEMYSKVFVRFVKAYSHPELASVSNNGVNGANIAKASPKKEARCDEDLLNICINNVREEILMSFVSMCSEEGKKRPKATTKLNNMKCTLFSNVSKKKR